MIHDPRSVEMVLNNFWNQPRICGQSIEKTDEGVLVRMRQPGWATYMDTATLGGAAAIAVGIYIICRPQKIFSLLPLAAGIFFLLDGIERIRCAAVMHRTVRRASNKREAAAVGRQKRRFYSACIIGVVTVLCGVLMLWNPFGALELTLRVCGALILCNGIGASWTSHALKMTVGQFGGDTHYPNHGGAYETEFRDITDTVK
jgi:uncharacterized membrane protein HdeD (DUF308 family)